MMTRLLLFCGFCLTILFATSQTRRVGIGTTTPITDFDLIGDTLGMRSSINASWDNLWFHVNGSTANITASGADNGMNFRVGSNSSGGYGVGQSFNTVMTLLPNGLIGIGTTTPYSQFSNTAKNIISSDGNGGNPGSFSWSANQNGYAALIHNEGNSVVSNGLAVKVFNPNSSAFDVSLGTQETLGSSLFCVKANGRIGIGSVNPGAPLDFRLGTGKTGMWILGGRGQTDCDGLLVLLDSSNNTAANGSNEMIAFANSGFGLIGSVTHNANANSVAYNTTSDARLKTDIRTTRYGLKDIMGIEVDDYTYKGIANAASQTGFLAQQLYTIYPEAVTKGDDADEKHPYMIDYSRLTPLLVKAVQELKAEVDALRQQVQQLQGKK